MGSAAAVNLNDESVTERSCVAQWDECRLFRYGAEDHHRGAKPPLLLVYALVNKPVILDLMEGVSTIARLLEEGLDVYLLEWGDPPVEAPGLSLEDYINGYIDQAVDYVRESRNEADVSLMGICQGGTLSLCYAALHPEKVAGLVTVVTPVDFQTPDNLLSHWSQLLDIDLLVDSMGNIPGVMLTSVFKSLQPGRLLLEKYLDLADSLDRLDEGKRRQRAMMFLAMERWIVDSPDQAGEAFRGFIKGCYQQNLLVKGRFRVGDKAVDLANLSMPVLNIFATQDHLVPPSASRVLEGFVPASDYRELEVDTGHIGMFVGSKALREMPTAVASWLQ
ncbi:unnamed protein product [Cyprideis torosa]|uniref:Poly(3-hydroxyalkanoate) polymerase subunit PhaC n=1 Tax=Cyprideis torosa TaxID=163714 RepID=A0A7R8WX85_9CRUS|nr:unnamed protein product [Cyprideis torosa]CAG0908472.1 unnamed protein product [Cyprideis torosa]